MDAPPPAADRLEKEEKQYTSRCMHSTNKQINWKKRKNMDAYMQL
jgi:hypothetical protein